MEIKGLKRVLLKNREQKFTSNGSAPRSTAVTCKICEEATKKFSEYYYETGGAKHGCYSPTCETIKEVMKYARTLR